MSKGVASNLTRWAGRCYARMPDAADRVMLGAVRRVRAAMKRQAAVERVSGRVALTDESLTVHVVGRSASVDYLLGRWLGKDVQIEAKGLAAPRAAIATAPLDTQLAIARGPRDWGDRAFGGGCWRVPEAVGSVIDLAGCDSKPIWESKSNKNNLRRIHKNGLTSSISHDEADFTYFYRQMYVPYTAGRFGELVASRSEHRMLRQFRRGGLVWVHQGDRRLAASLFSSEGGRVRSWILAPDPQHPDAVNLGSLIATYLFMLQWSMAHGQRELDLGASRPVLTDGVLVHKKYWGAAVCEEPGVDHDLLLHWPRMTPAIARCLHESPLVVRDEGRLSGLTAMPLEAAPDPKQTRAHLERVTMPGLARLHVIADAPWRFDSPQVRGQAVCWLASDAVSAPRSCA